MLIKTCHDCRYHEVKQEQEDQMSYCSRENCWSEYSKCIANRALSRFLEQETSENHRPFTAIGSMYPTE